MALTLSQKAAKARYKARHPERVKAQSAAHSRKYYAANREQIILRVKLRKFGLTEEQYQQMVEDAAGQCEICETPFGEDKATKIHVDHCHSTNTLRGLLCASCNWALGNARDDPSRLRKMIIYLENHNA